MTARHIQYLLAAVFFILGGWCLVSPGSARALTIWPAYLSHDPIVPVPVAAFGSQALLSGLFAAFSRFTRTTFAAYAIALLPLFVFDYWFYMVEPMLSPLGMLDAAGNVAMLLLCWLGWKRA